MADMVQVEQGNQEEMPALQPPRAPRNSCSAEIWTDKRYRRDEDHNDEHGHPEQHQATHKRGLLQRLRWPSERGRGRDRSPRRHGEGSSRQRGWQRGDQSLSPATRRSRERSLERLAHRLRKAEEETDRKRKPKQAGGCSNAKSAREDSPDDTTPTPTIGGGVRKKMCYQDHMQLDTLMRKSDTEVRQPAREQSRDPMLEESKTPNLQEHMLGTPNPDTGDENRLQSPDLWVKKVQPNTNREGPDPMMEEAELGETAIKRLKEQDPHFKVANGTNIEPLKEILGPDNGNEQQEHGSATGELLGPTNMAAVTSQSVPAPVNTESRELGTQQFIEKVTATVPNPVIPTPARKTKKATESLEDDQTVRRSGRLAIKQKQAGKKHSEEMAQEVLAKKLGALSPEKDLTEEAKTKITQLFQGPLTKDVMQAMEDLLQAMNIDIKKGAISGIKSAAKKTK